MTEQEFAILRPGSKVVVISSGGEWDHCLVPGRIYTVIEIDTSCDGLRLSSLEDWHVVDQWVPREETEFLKL